MRPLRLLVVLAAVSSACSADLEVPSDVTVVCDSDRSCPTGRRCLLAQRTCVIETSACVVPGVEGLSAVEDGRVCTKGNGDPGVCARGICRDPPCGDGVLDLGEVCDDSNTISGDGCRGDCRKIEVCGDNIVDANEACDDANENPNDGCEQCRSTVWDPAVVTGLGVGAGVPDDVHIFSGSALAVDADGVIYLVDQLGRRLWRLDRTNGVVTSIAGTGVAGFTEDGAAVHASGINPVITYSGLALTNDKALVFLDSVQARSVDVASGLITTIAGGNGICSTSAQCPSGSSATANLPGGLRGVAYDALSGATYVATSSSNTVSAVKDGLIYAIVGDASWTAGSAYSDGSPGSDVLLNQPTALAFDAVRRLLYIVDAGNARIMSYDVDNDIVRRVAGNGTANVSVDGTVASGNPIRATPGFSMPLAVGRDGTLYFVEGNRIRTVVDGTLRTIAGTGAAGSSGDEGPATAAAVTPNGLAFDRLGTLYFSELLGNGATQVTKIRSVTADGVVHGLYQWNARGALPLGYVPRATAFGSLQSFAIADNGDVYVSSSNPSIILRSPLGTAPFEVIAGLGDRVADGIPANTAQLRSAEGLRLRANGDIVFADPFSHAVRRIEAATGIISTIAGTLDSEGMSGDGSAATSAKLSQPCDVEYGPNDDLYIYDCGNGRIRRVDATTRTITTIVGSSIHNVPATFCTGQSSACGDGGQGVAATLSSAASRSAPPTLNVRSNGDIYFSEPNRPRLRLYVASTGIVSTIVGNAGTCPSTLQQCGDTGLASSATLQSIGGFAVDTTGITLATLRLRRITGFDAGARIDTLGFGNNGLPRGDGGLIENAAGNASRTIVVRNGVTYVSDSTGIRTLTPQNDATFNGVVIDTLAGLSASVGDGSALLGQLGAPVALAAYGPASWLITDGAAGRLRLFDSASQSVSTVGGLPLGFGASGSMNDPVWPPRAYYANLLRNATAIAYDSRRDVYYFAETNASLIRRLTARGDVRTWSIETLTGQGFADRTDGPLASAAFSRPSGIAYDTERDALWVADTGNHTIRYVDLSSGVVSTVAGFALMRGYAGDGGEALNAYLSDPSAIVVNAVDGSLYVADTGNHRVRRLVPDSGGAITGTSLITTVVGDGSASSAGVGAPAASFSVESPRGLAIDRYGNLWISSTTTIRVLSAGADGIAREDDGVQTVYGEPPRTTFPENVTHCLTGLAPYGDGASVYALDACQGYLLSLQRRLKDLR